MIFKLCGFSDQQEISFLNKPVCKHSLFILKLSLLYKQIKLTASFNCAGKSCLNSRPIWQLNSRDLQADYVIDSIQIIYMIS